MNSTEIMNDYVIENLKCSFLNCRGQGELIPSNNNFLYFYQQQNPHVFRMGDLHQSDQINTQQTQIKFICQACSDIMMSQPIQPIEQIKNYIQLDDQQYDIFIEKDGRDTSNPPKKGKFTEQKQKCKKCLENEDKMQDFDQNLKNQLSRNNYDIDTKIKIARYYAEEQYKNDKKMFETLKQKLRQGNYQGKIEQLMILNKMKMIMQKYQ
ncbi:unnamed protein product [Paramecium octaurelia]|uniref:Uncharacterized protein n=1 Tax=Paramecium octaurelia TaxID=43137 RepID=A0A8S1XA94_PAROT|nr:unnamed protein product [Paramecium octaurelia]